MNINDIDEWRAKRILIKSGFIQDFYYIKKVLESFKSCQRAMRTFQTFSWGKERLTVIRNQLLKKHKGELLALHIRTLCDYYICQLSEIDTEVFYTLCRRYGALGPWNLVDMQEK